MIKELLNSLKVWMMGFKIRKDKTEMISPGIYLEQRYHDKLEIGLTVLSSDDNGMMCRLEKDGELNQYVKIDQNGCCYFEHRKDFDDLEYDQSLFFVHNDILTMYYYLEDGTIAVETDW